MCVLSCVENSHEYKSPVFGYSSTPPRHDQKRSSARQSCTFSFPLFLFVGFGFLDPSDLYSLDLDDLICSHRTPIQDLFTPLLDSKLDPQLMTYEARRITRFGGQVADHASSKTSNAWSTAVLDSERRHAQILIRFI